jgi:hypothetical protein
MFQANVVQKIKSHFMINKVSFFFRKSCRVGDNVEKHCAAGRPQMTLWFMRNACWIPKATNTHSEYVLRIDFLRQQWLPERALM